MTREMTGAEMVMEALADQGVKHLFGYPGGAVHGRLPFARLTSRSFSGPGQ